jgi:hypothetical protein
MDMAANRVQIVLDEDLVRRAREHAPTGASDDELIADAVAEWLAFAALEAPPLAALAPRQADDVAISEVRAHRASRDAAA